MQILQSIFSLQEWQDAIALNHWDAIHVFVVFAPFIIGSAYFLLKFFVRVILRVRKDPFFNPVPMRIWYGFAVNNIFMAASPTDVPILIGTVLLVMIFYFVQEDFGIAFS